MQLVADTHDTLSRRGKVPGEGVGLATIDHAVPSHCSISVFGNAKPIPMIWVIVPVMTQWVGVVHDTPEKAKSTSISTPDEPMLVHFVPFHCSTIMKLSGRPEP